MHELEPKYPVRESRTHMETTEQLGRIARKLTSRAVKVSGHGGVAYDKGVHVDIDTTSGGHKKIEVKTYGSDVRRPSTRVKVTNGAQTKLELSAGRADTMHGAIFKGELSDPLLDKPIRLTGEEAVHETATSLAEVRSAIANAEGEARQSAAEHAAAQQQIKQDALMRLHQ